MEGESGTTQPETETGMNGPDPGIPHSEHHHDPLGCRLYKRVSADVELRVLNVPY